MTRILVTGANGLLGRHVLERVAGSGAVVAAAIHRTYPRARLKGVRYLEVDLTRPDDCRRALRGCDIVFHCAGVTGGVGATLGRIAPVTRAMAMHSQVLDAAAECGVGKLGLVSSTTLYPAFDVPMEESRGFEGEPFEGYRGIGWMSRALERMAGHVADCGGPEIAMIRPSNIYGPGDDFVSPGAHVLPALIRRALARENPFVVWGDGSAVRDFVYVDDAARAFELAMARGRGAGPINVGGSGPVGISDLVERVLSICGHDGAEIQFDRGKPTALPYRAVDGSKAETVLDYRPEISLDEGIRRSVAWYREHGKDETA